MADEADVAAICSVEFGDEESGSGLDEELFFVEVGIGEEDDLSRSNMPTSVFAEEVCPNG